MLQRTYYIKARWDPEAEVFVSESDIKGLHIEAATLDEFEAIMMDVAVDLIVANHIPAPDVLNRPLRDLVPAILWQRPEETVAGA